MYMGLDIQVQTSLQSEASSFPLCSCGIFLLSWIYASDSLVRPVCSRRHPSSGVLFNIHAVKANGLLFPLFSCLACIQSITRHSLDYWLLEKPCHLLRILILSVRLGGWPIDSINRVCKLRHIWETQYFINMANVINEGGQGPAARSPNCGTQFGTHPWWWRKSLRSRTDCTTDTISLQRCYEISKMNARFWVYRKVYLPASNSFSRSYGI